jgi:hypothetical protein
VQLTQGQEGMLFVCIVASVAIGFSPLPRGQSLEQTPEQKARANAKPAARDSEAFAKQHMQKKHGGTAAMRKKWKLFDSKLTVCST